MNAAHRHNMQIQNTCIFKFLTLLTTSVDKFFIITNKCTNNITTVFPCITDTPTCSDILCNHQGVTHLYKRLYMPLLTHTDCTKNCNIEWILCYCKQDIKYLEGPATGHLDTGFSRFPCAYKQTLRRFPTFQVATTCFSCSPPDLNLVVTNFMFRLHLK